MCAVLERLIYLRGGVQDVCMGVMEERCDIFSRGGG